MKNKIALSALALTLSLGATAQQDSTSNTMRVDLQTAMSSAIQQNKQLRASSLDRDLYYQKVREARASGLPQVSASLAGTTYFGKALEFSGMEVEMENTINLSATVSWTFAMAQIGGVKLAKISQEVAEQGVQSTELDIKANVSDTYYAVLVYERNLEILQDNLKDMEDIASHTKHQLDAGTVEPTDLDQMNINVLTLKNSILSVQRSLESTKRLLALQMGIPIDTKIQTAQTLDELMAANDAVIDTASLDIENNIEYKTLALSQQVNEQTVKVRKYAYIPTLTAAYQYSHDFKGGFMSFEHVGTLTLNIPIFSGFERHSQLQQAKIEVERTNMQMSLLEDNLYQNAEQYAFELQTAIDGYNFQKENLEVARRVLANYRNKYEQGALSSLDLTQANTNYLSAESSYASACLTLMQAQTQLIKLYNAF